jgi:Lon protease-like protein
MAGPNWDQLPLFPLNTVLFPGMVLPLHIFEDRYKLMIRRCLDEDRPFGVVLIRSGQEVGQAAEPHTVGTTAQIIKAEKLEEERWNIVTVGRQRFRVEKLVPGLPYLVSQALPYPLEGVGAEWIQDLVSPLQRVFQRYSKLLQDASGIKLRVTELPDSPEMMAMLTAIALQVSNLQKQALLSLPSLGEMLRAERRLLAREEGLLTYIIDTQEQQWEGGFSGYLAQN